MKVAIIGSRTLVIENLEEYLPQNTTEIVSGGAKGIDSSARDFAGKHNIKLTEFLPQYQKYGKAAPIVRNREIVTYSDMVIAFWDGKSRGTKSVIDLCKKQNKPINIHIIK